MQENSKLDLSLKLIAKSSVIIFVSLFISKIFVYVYRAIIARHFGPEVYGLYSLAIMIVSWFVVFSILGLNQGILRYVPFYHGRKETDKIRYVFKKTKHYLFFLSIFFGVVLFLSSEFISTNIFHNPNLTIFLKIFSIAIPLLVLSNLYLFLILSFEKIGWYSFIYNILQNGIKVFSLILFIFIGLKINALYFSYILGIFLALLTAYFVSKNKLKPVFEKFTLTKKEKSKVFKEVFYYSLPLLFYGITYTIMVWTDSFLIGYFLDAKSVGFYNAAIPIAMLLIISSELFTQLFFPMINKEYSKNKKKNHNLIKQLSQQVGKWIVLFNLPLLLLIFIFPENFINIIFGNQYSVAANSLRLLSVGIFFSSLFSVSKKLILMFGKPKVVLIDTLIAAIINIFLNIFFIQKYGILGAAFSTMISLIFLNLLFLFQSKKYLSIIPLRRKIARILLVSIFPTALLFFLKNRFNYVGILELIILGPFFILSYFLLILITSCLDKNDLMVLKSIKNKFS